MRLRPHFLAPALLGTPTRWLALLGGTSTTTSARRLDAINEAMQRLEADMAVVPEQYRSELIAPHLEGEPDPGAVDQDRVPSNGATTEGASVPAAAGAVAPGATQNVDASSSFGSRNADPAVGVGSSQPDPFDLAPSDVFKLRKEEKLSASPLSFVQLQERAETQGQQAQLTYNREAPRAEYAQQGGVSDGR